MSNPAKHHTLSYIEFASTDIEKSKALYSTVFGWSFEDWGPDYISFSGAGIDGGFRRAATSTTPGENAPLAVLYSADLQATEDAVRAAGGVIVVPVFAFPGGRRFHFSDGAGNVLAVWSE